jgi:hypothetical protein
MLIWYWPCSLPREENSTNTGRHSPPTARTKCWRARRWDQVRLQLQRQLRRAGFRHAAQFHFQGLTAAGGAGSKPLMCSCGRSACSALQRRA